MGMSPKIKREVSGDQMEGDYYQIDQFNAEERKDHTA
jgi:hypothetical protein